MVAAIVGGTDRLMADDAGPASQNAEKFVVRLPKGMRRRIADAARSYRRSMNSEIVARLEHSLTSGTTPFPDPVAADADVAGRPSTDAAAPAPAGTPTNTEEESELLRCYRALSPERRRALLALLG